MTKNSLGSFFGEAALALEVKEKLAPIDEVKDEVEAIGRLEGVVQ